MADWAFLIAATGAVLVGLAGKVPAIVWSIRCPADSPNYRHPAVISRIERLAMAMGARQRVQ